MDYNSFLFLDAPVEKIEKKRAEISNEKASELHEKVKIDFNAEITD